MLTLEVLTPASEAAFADLADDFARHGDDRYLHPAADFAGYLARCREGELPGRRAGLVPQSIYWLVREGRLLGSSRLRHWLTPELEHEGGHIGYDVRPSDRRRGYGTILLGLTLERAAALGLRSVRITCDATNIGSIRVIEKNGGVLAGEALSRRRGVPIPSVLDHPAAGRVGQAVARTRRTAWM